MKFQIIRIVFTIIFLCLLACKDELTKPNIILFLVDDLGWQDTSVPFWKETTHFNQRYQTPNMERLVKDGMKFTQAYATSVCSPTRVSLMTGMNAARHRVTNWTLHKDKIQPMESNHPDLDFPMWNVNGIAPDASVKHAVHATTFPSILKENGYTTIHVGKAHLGAISTPASNPLDIGFDVNIAGHAAGAPGSYYGLDNFGNNKDGSPKNIWSVPGLTEFHGKKINLTEALTQKSITALDSALKLDKPFFLYMSHYTVHTPLMGDNRFFHKYLEVGLDTIEAQYASMVEGMDRSLGDLLDYLEKHNIEDKTAILFMSDNGGLSAVARGGAPHTHNKPLSSGKGSAREGGIREPMIVKWPGVVAPGSTNHNYLIIEDYYPSILAIAGIENYKTIQQIDGQSFIPLLKQTRLNSLERELIWHFPNEWGPSGPGIGASSTIRKGDWKLIYYHLDQRFELFNLKTDIGETQNLANDKPEQLKKLAKALTDYLINVDAQMPLDKNSGIQIPFPTDVISNHMDTYENPQQRKYSDHYYNKKSIFESQPDTKNEIIFLGNSITEGGNWKELFPDINVVNRGISGDVTDGILNRLDEVTSSQPKKIFLMIGTNDLARGRSVQYVSDYCRKIIEKILRKSPNTELYIQSVLPINPNIGERFTGHKSKKNEILAVNKKLKAMSIELKIKYIDLHGPFSNSKGFLKSKYTHDGLHISEAGYGKWKSLIQKYSINRTKI